MKKSFSFSEKPVLFLIQKFPLLLPGINKVIAVYYDTVLERLNSYSLIKSGDGYLLEESDVADVGDSLIKFRGSSTPYSWMQDENIPFEILSKDKVQLTIFNELNNNILLIRISNENDGLSDLFFIYFNPSPSNFGLVDSKKSITTENKTIIGHLLKNSLEEFLSSLKKDRELFITLSENNHSIIQDLNNTKKDLTLTREKNKDLLVHLCKRFLEDHSRDYQIHFAFSAESVIKLREYDEEPGHLRNIIKRAVEYAFSAHLNSDCEEIIIHDHQLIFNLTPDKKSAEVVSVIEPNSEIPVRYNKTFLFLNKLETAAQAVKSKNLLLTSVNVGHEFPSPVTPAAITDALKNHQSKITYLFKLLPGRWQVIRSEFRPVQNILNPKVERQRRTG